MARETALRDGTGTDQDRKLTVRVEEVGFLYTYKCNFQCDHCGLACSPAQTEKLEMATVSRVLDEAARLKIPGVAFSGGEPFLYFEEMLALVDQAHRNGLSSAMVTNGSWGATSAAAGAKVGLLKKSGLGTLQISYDEFHLRAGSKRESVTNIIAACREQGIRVIIKRTKGSRKDQDSSRIEQDIAEFKQLGCDIDETMLLPFGTAFRTLPVTENRYVRVPVDKVTGCDTIGLNVTYTPDGTLRPCCGFAILEIQKNPHGHLLELGNIYKDTLAEGIERLKDNLFLLILAVLGPAGFKLLSREYPNAIVWPDSLRCICDFCVFASQSHAVGQWLLELEEHKDEILSRLSACNGILNRWGIAHNQNVVQASAG